MLTETPAPALQLSDAYRRARRITATLCAVALAWATAQFDFNALSLGPGGSLDLSGASVPLVLLVGLIYATTRCTIEFAMQSEGVRGWRLAQLDFKLTVWLVRAAALMLGAGAMYRSIETVLVVAFMVVVSLSAAFLLIWGGVFALAPLMIRLRARRGSRDASPIWAILEAEGWATLITVVVICFAFAALGFGFLLYGPLRALWTTPPTITAATVFVLTSIAVVLSVYFQPKWFQGIFVDERAPKMKRLPDGTIAVTFPKTEAAQSDTPRIQLPNGPPSH